MDVIYWPAAGLRQWIFGHHCEYWWPGALGISSHSTEYTLVYTHAFPAVYIAGTLGRVFIDNETHESGVTKCTTGEAWSAFSGHHSSVFHCQWTHNQVFLLLSHMLIWNAKSIFIYVMKYVSGCDGLSLPPCWEYPPSHCARALLNYLHSKYFHFIG